MYMHLPYHVSIVVPYRSCVLLIVKKTRLKLFIVYIIMLNSLSFHSYSLCLSLRRRRKWAPKAPGGSGRSAGGSPGAAAPAGFDLPGEVARGTANPFGISSLVSLWKWHYWALMDRISPLVDWLCLPLFYSPFCPSFMPYLVPEVLPLLP